MEQRQLGTSGLTVSAIGLGGNNFGDTVDGDEAIRTIQEAISQGVTFIDSADVYSMGRAEELVGQAISGQRESVVVSSKCGIQLDIGQHAAGLSRRWIIQAAEDSLRRLGTDYIDVYFAHWPDSSTPIEETLRAMDDLVRSGKVRYLACSNYRAWEIAHSIGVSKQLGLERWVGAQNRWNLLDGLDSRELEQASEALGVGIIPHTPLASGLLTGKYEHDSEPQTGTRLGDIAWLRSGLTEKRIAQAKSVQAWAEERGHTSAEAAIAWLLAHPVVSSVAVGALTTEQVAANIKAAEWVMTPEERDELTALVAEE